MSSKKATKVDVTYKNGFMVGRMMTIDESEGFDVPVPGCEVRIRVSSIVTYVYGSPHCILVSFGVEEESVQVWGTMEAMDDVVSRDRLGGLVGSPPVTAVAKVPGGRPGPGPWGPTTIRPPRTKNPW